MAVKNTVLSPPTSMSKGRTGGRPRVSREPPCASGVAVDESQALVAAHEAGDGWRHRPRVDLMWGGSGGAPNSTQTHPQSPLPLHYTEDVDKISPHLRTLGLPA